MKIKEIEEYIENELAPLSLSLPGDKNGLHFGTLNGEVNGVVVCWSPTLRVIEKTIEMGANLIVCHEWLIYDFSGNKWIEKERSTYSKVPNLKRLRLLTQHDVTVLKHHSNWDLASGGVADSFGEYLEFINLIGRGKVTRIYKVKPKKIGELAEEIAEKLNIGCVRVLGNPNKKVEYVGTAVGGLGQILTFADDFFGTKAQLLIFGEILEYAGIYALESGFNCIITTHEASEKPGIIKLSDLLRRAFPKIRVDYIDSMVSKGAFVCHGL